MKTDSISTPHRSSRTSEVARPGGRRIAVAAVAAVMALGASACQSDPGPKRVAQDIIESERERGTIDEAQAECMLEKLDGYSDSELRAIDSDLDAGDGSSQLAEGRAAIAAYEADLAECVAPTES